MTMLSSSTSMRCNTNKKKVSCGTPSPPRTELQLLCSVHVTIRDMDFFCFSSFVGSLAKNLYLQ
ncbi:hypothetical protein V8C40DRAFT_232489 [Trichoderma camerunense]